MMFAVGIVAVIYCILAFRKRDRIHVDAIQVIRYQESHSERYPGFDYPLKGLSIFKATVVNNALLWDTRNPDFYMLLAQEDDSIVIKYFNCRDQGDLFVAGDYRLLMDRHGRWEEITLDSDEILMDSNVPVAGKSTGLQDGSLTDGSVTLVFPLILEKGRYRVVMQASTYYQPYTWWYVYCDFYIL